MVNLCPDLIAGGAAFAALQQSGNSLKFGFHYFFVKSCR
ncbi:hypothetical protein MRBBS_1992 [Marinobacter sp. BSs20148]|nr:hypothetical protein MRBBS_1992 [Marinobacter sp. BSs20148]